MTGNVNFIYEKPTISDYLSQLSERDLKANYAVIKTLIDKHFQQIPDGKDEKQYAKELFEKCQITDDELNLIKQIWGKQNISHIYAILMEDTQFLIENPDEVIGMLLYAIKEKKRISIKRHPRRLILGGQSNVQTSPISKNRNIRGGRQSNQKPKNTFHSKRKSVNRKTDSISYRHQQSD